MLQGSSDTNVRARRLRSEMSLPEVTLWKALRLRPDGLKFRRQHPAGLYVADFYCHAARLVVEIDGTAHDFGDRPQSDAKRDLWFEAAGLHVLRIPAREVLRDLDAVVCHIIATAAHAAPPPSGLRPATSPVGGGLVVEH